MVKCNPILLSTQLCTFKSEMASTWRIPPVPCSSRFNQSLVLVLWQKKAGFVIRSFKYSVIQLSMGCGAKAEAAAPYFVSKAPGPLS